MRASISLCSAPGNSSIRRSKVGKQRINVHPKPLPPITNDAEAENFLETADLSKYNLPGFAPIHFEIAPKAASLNLLPACRSPESSEGQDQSQQPLYPLRPNAVQNGCGAAEIRRYGRAQPQTHQRGISLP
ncbi:CopG family antitoxin [Paracoccus liaowanqingii]|uniref:CopG family antitoxin n=1 Tax=Paracoccus liaowanqingii TaxID=2560053 RepID=UPI001981D1F4